MYELVIETQAKKYLRSLDPPLRLRIAEDVYSLGMRFMDGKRLSGRLVGTRSFRSGEYRILYEVDYEKKIVRVLRIGNRKEIYRI